MFNFLHQKIKLYSRGGIIMAMQLAKKEIKSMEDNKDISKVIIKPDKNGWEIIIYYQNQIDIYSGEV